MHSLYVRYRILADCAVVMTRESDYKQEYCDEVVKLGKEGKSVAQMCAHFDICRQTIDNWAKANPPFLEALTRAKTHMQAKLEEMGFNGLTNREFNAPVWKKTMEARFREDYTERKEVENTGNVTVNFLPEDADL